MKPKKKKYGRPPVRSLKELRIGQLSLDQKIRQYLVSWKPEVSDQLRKSLELRAAQDLNAANLISRIQIAESLTSNLQSHFQENHTRAVFFVTLISELHAVKVDGHEAYDLADHCKWIASVLGGADYIGMIEVAYFSRVAFLTPQEDWLSWHAHVMVWNLDEKALKKLKSAANTIEVAFQPDGLPFHYRKARPDNIEPEIAYLSKSPRSEYNPYYPRRSNVPSGDGDKSLTTPRLKPNKREIRTGKLLAALSALSDKSLKSLMVAGGEGMEIRDKSLKAARRACKSLISKSDV
ncbi:hypothetical protein [Agrobacterium sp. lyk4-40-TYG-31]|uniref:hypothetical protein n=1 Tax=Agrobacterium sp. lyk4-40-TYG-31 TaxID=3040276 RepID=UPI00254C9921|nr:hypothetical protein [Agrobacterium sp. lyk4-40-TYG-31]